MLKTKVKVGKVTNLSEARYSAGMGVDFLSFPSSVVDPKTFQEITSWVAGPKFGIEMDSENHDKYTVDFVEASFDSLENIPQGSKAFVELHVNDWFEKKENLIKAKEKVLAIELNIRSIDDSRKIIEDISNFFEVFLKLTASSDLQSILELHISGISLEGNSETKPGLKEYPLSEILEQLEID